MGRPPELLAAVMDGYIVDNQMVINEIKKEIWDGIVNHAADPQMIATLTNIGRLVDQLQINTFGQQAIVKAHRMKTEPPDVLNELKALAARIEARIKKE